jgi:hypothetical protein
LYDWPTGFFSEKFDIAVIAPPNGNTVQSLAPLGMFHVVPDEITFDSLHVMNGQRILNFLQINGSCFHQFEFEENLVSG